jgi:hypothetical protein
VVPSAIVCEGGVYKLLDIQFFTQLTTYLKCLFGLNTSFILSPELLQALKHRDFRPTYDLFKSDIFCLGLCGLCMGSMKSVLTIYDLDNFEIKVDVLETELIEIKNQYSEKLYLILKGMLRIHAEDRSCF